jgi:hypothetical protein
MSESAKARVGVVKAAGKGLLPAYAYALLLFPGVVAHELAHYLAVVAAGLAPRKVVWFSLAGDNYGELHFEYDRFKTSIWSLALVHFAPLLLSSFLALALFDSSYPLLSGPYRVAGAFLFYAACSIALSAVPSWVDYANFFVDAAAWPAKKLLSKSLLDKLVFALLFVPWLLLYVVSKFFYLAAKAAGGLPLGLLWATFLFVVSLRF